jgi:hypothetical protein
MSSVRNISLYIPRVFSNFTKKYIAEAFEKIFIGKVSKIDFVAKMYNGTVYNSACIHFEYWYDNVAALNFQNRVLDPNQEARLIYDEPWYWIVLENKAKKRIQGERKLRINNNNNNNNNNKTWTSIVNAEYNPKPKTTPTSQRDDNYKYYLHREDYSRSPNLGTWLSEPSVELKQEEEQEELTIKQKLYNILYDYYKDNSVSRRHPERTGMVVDILIKRTIEELEDFMTNKIYLEECADEIFTVLHCHLDPPILGVIHSNRKNHTNEHCSCIVCRKE